MMVRFKGMLILAVATVAALAAAGADEGTTGTLPSPALRRKMQSTDWDTISYEDFEDGFGEWESGGYDVKLYEGHEYSYEGNGAIELRDNSDDKSTATMRTSFDARAYDELRVQFWFIAIDFDQTWEDFFLEISSDDGKSWERVREWDYKRHFENGVFGKKTKYISRSSYVFTNEMKFRFQCDASNNSDRLFLDNIEISGRSSSGGDGGGGGGGGGDVNSVVTYHPGELKSSALDSHGIRWSEGLSGKRITRTDDKVVYDDGSKSNRNFHVDPDAGACFPTSDDGWVYVSNSEDPIGENSGGVGAIYFDKKGRVIDYDWILSSTYQNCGGGKSPWNTWLSCEENGKNGAVFEVDPQGRYGSTSKDSKYRYGRKTCLGEGGGNFESVAYDGRGLDPNKCASDSNKCQVDFFVTHDDDYGEIRKYTPKPSVVQSGYKSKNFLSILEKTGTYSDCSDIRDGDIKYLHIDGGSGGSKGTFRWSSARSKGQDTAFENFPYNEGIDVKDGKLYTVSKTTKTLFIFDLDDLTWTKSSTKRGVFSDQPDQIKFITGDSSGAGADDGLLYFTEDGGSTCGIHARNRLGQYVTIMESNGRFYNSETTGLAFSPNKMHMYVAFQNKGDVWDITRDDGYPFDGDFLDIKYHNSPTTK